MDIPINHLAVFVAALSTMAVGSIWYSPALFYKRWARLAKVTDDSSRAPASSMIVMFGSVFLASWLMSYVLAATAYLANVEFRNSFVQDTIMVAFWLWAGFVASRFFVHDTFEGRPRQLTVLNAAHEGLTLLVMALIIGMMGY